MLDLVPGVFAGVSTGGAYGPGCLRTLWWCPGCPDPDVMEVPVLLAVATVVSSSSSALSRAICSSSASAASVSPRGTWPHSGWGDPGLCLSIKLSPQGRHFRIFSQLCIRHL